MERERERQRERERDGVERPVEEREAGGRDCEIARLSLQVRKH